MKDKSTTPGHLVSEAYRQYRLSVFRYIYYRIGSKEDAEDMLHDAFLRLMECGRLLREDTVRSFLFTITRNLIIDYLRRYYRRQDAFSSLMEESPVSAPEAESHLAAAELQALEREKVALLPACRRQVYILSRFRDESADDIAARLHLSKRTVERHILMGRREVREYIRQCI